MRKDLLSRLADAGEDAIARLAEAPSADRVMGFANNMRDRMDEMQKRVRGIDALEKRIEELERRVETLSSKPTRAKAAAPRSSGVGRTGTAGRRASRSSSTTAPAACRAASRAS